MTGVIRTLKDGFGFIEGEDGLDYFFLASALDRMAGVTFDQLGDGQTVTFIGIEHPKGPRAISVRRIS